MTQARKRDSKPQGWLQPINNQGRLVIQFQLNGKTYKFAPVTKGKFDNVSDYRRACQVCEQIEWDIRRGEFDSTLEKYKPKVEQPPETKQELTLGYLWEQYKKDKELVVEKTTQKKHWKAVDIALKKCKLVNCIDFNQVKDTLLSTYSISSTRTVLVPLNAALNHAVKKDVIIKNPLNQITADIKKAEKRKQAEEGTTSCKAFTKQERDRIIQAFSTNEFCSKYSRFKHSYYIPFVQFLFFTGCRPEDATALIWGDIKGNQIVFTKAHSNGILKGGKNSNHSDKGVRRMPINAHLRQILDDYKASLPEDKTTPECLVFTSVEDGGYLNTNNFTTRTWNPIVKKLVELGEVKEYLPTYNCRHTFITLCLEAGVPVHTVAKWVGNSPEIIYSNYCSDISQIQVPDLS